MTQKAEVTTETEIETEADESTMFIDDGESDDKPTDELSANDGAPGDGESDDSIDDEVVVTIGDSPAPDEDHEQAPEWVRELRKNHRETQKRVRELEAENKQLKGTGQKPVQLGQKPKLEDYEYDTEKFEQALTAWHEDKRKADAAKAEADKQAEAAEKAWNERLNLYGEKKSELKVKDFEDAESVVLEKFSQTQQGIIVQGADNSALVFYAIGKNPGKASELASITDPVKFAFAVAKLEKELKVTNRKAPPPEKKVASGTAPKGGAVDSTLERLREDARKTGDFSKVNQYRRDQKKKAASG
jgi:hypothetical protein